MDHFQYQRGALHAEQVSLPALAEAVGTPFYCYSTATLTRHYRVFEESLHGLDTLICFAVKANSNIAVLRTLADLGSGADVVSGGEIQRALRAGITPDRVVFSGVGKTREEMAFALETGIYQFNVESVPELLALNDIAAQSGQRAAIAIRVNPDVDAETHAKISTGRYDNKFGIPLADAPEVYAKAQSLDHIEVQGVSMHIGSQLTSLAPYRRAYEKLRQFVIALRQQGCAITTLDLGGGLGIPYDTESPPPPAEYGACVQEVFRDLDCRLIFEPGRMIAGNAGILVTRVIYVKEGNNRRFAIVDAAMNDLLRPAMYDAHHTIVPVAAPGEGSPTSPYDVVGPVCETGDTFARGRQLPAIQAGDLLAFRSAGAYGAVMASTYNTRPLVPEVLVQDDQYAVIRQRQDVSALLAMEHMAAWQSSDDKEAK